MPTREKPTRVRKSIFRPLPLDALDDALGAFRKRAAGVRRSDVLAINPLLLGKVHPSPGKKSEPEPRFVALVDVVAVAPVCYERGACGFS